MTMMIMSMTRRGLVVVVVSDDVVDVAPNAPSPVRFQVTVSNTTTTNPTPTPTAVGNSRAPSMAPTNAWSLATGQYLQGFLLPVSNTDIFFNETEVESFTTVLEGYTPILLLNNNLTSDTNVDVDTVQSNCTVLLQSGSNNSLNQVTNDVNYRCQYSSRFINVMDLPVFFVTYLNQNLNQFTTDLRQSNISVNISFPVSQRLVPSPSPTTSLIPSQIPSQQPSTSVRPSRLPSMFPTQVIDPTSDPEFFIPTRTQSPTISMIDPTFGSSGQQGAPLSLLAIIAIVIIGGFVGLAGLYVYYQSRQKRADAAPAMSADWRRSQPGISSSSTARSRRHLIPTFRSNRASDHRLSAPARRFHHHPTIPNDDDDDAIIDARHHHHHHHHDPANYVISPSSDSRLSLKSLLSTGDSVMAEGSGEANDHSEDGTKNLQDEFDLYKDQNLELLRTDVEGNLSGFEGYMSAAVTNALMGDDEKKNYEMSELLWGCDPNPDGTEIEASALFEVTDWLTRNESAGTERKGAFMQEILNKMVTSVRFGVIVAEDASRTIHESAAILGLQLAEDLPVTTVIISGLRKTTRATDIIHALNEFGEIDVAAVASGKRGFGIVRFRRRISVDHALQQYRAGEIVILDVSIQLKVLMPNGVLESR